MFPATTLQKFLSFRKFFTIQWTAGNKRVSKKLQSKGAYIKRMPILCKRKSAGSGTELRCGFMVLQKQQEKVYFQLISAEVISNHICSVLPAQAAWCTSISTCLKHSQADLTFKDIQWKPSASALVDQWLLDLHLHYCLYWNTLLDQSLTFL